MYASLHRDRKQLLQHQQSILDVQRSVAHLRQELQARTQRLQVGAPSIFAWSLCVPPATLGGKGLERDDGVEGEDDLPRALGEEPGFQAMAVITDQGEKKGPVGGGEPGGGGGVMI